MRHVVNALCVSAALVLSHGMAFGEASGVIGGVGGSQNPCFANPGSFSCLQATCAQSPGSLACTTGLLSLLGSQGALIGQLSTDVSKLKQEVAGLTAATAAQQAQINGLKSKTASLTASTRDGKPALIVTGVNLYLQDGSGGTMPSGNSTGLGNLIIGYNEKQLPSYADPNLVLNVQNSDGSAISRNGSHNLVLGLMNSYDHYAGIVGGVANRIDAPDAVVLSGVGNQVWATDSVVLTGVHNWIGDKDIHSSANDPRFSVSLTGFMREAFGAFCAITDGGFSPGETCGP